MMPGVVTTKASQNSGIMYHIHNMYDSRGIYESRGIYDSRGMSDSHDV